MLPPWIQEEKARQEATAKQEAVVKNMTSYVLLGQMLKEWWVISSSFHNLNKGTCLRRIYPTKYNPVQKYFLEVCSDELENRVLSINVYKV